ncbi:putative reverse transcriptase domain-containing protein [Tanacetum coccineum]
MILLIVGNDLWPETLDYSKGNLTQRRADDSSRNNHGHQQQQPFKGKNVAKGLQHGDRRKEGLIGWIPAPSATSAISTTMARAPREGQWGSLPKEWYVLSCGAPGLLSKELVPKLRIKMEEMGMHKDGFMQLGMHKSRGEHQGTLMQMSSLAIPFNIDLMPVELGSFDVIIGMDWLRRCHAVIVFCTDIPKKRRYKSERKQIEDVPIVRDFPEVFPEDLPGLPPARTSWNSIDLDPELHPVFIRPSSSPWGAPVLFVKKKDGSFIQFLGHVIDSRGIHVDPAKIESIKDWASPKTPTEIRQFLGLLLKKKERFPVDIAEVVQCPILALPEGAKTLWYTAMRHTKA